jgi:hypothetical protein
MKKNKKYRADLLEVTVAGFVLGLTFTVLVIKGAIDARKKETLKTF